MANVLVDEQVLADVADAIRIKSGSSDHFYPSQMSDAILQIPQGNSSGSNADPKKEIRFFDYEGSLLHSFSLEELAQLESLPELPTRDGLICEGWNWNLEDLKALNRRMDVGAMYVTDDGATRIYVEITADTLHPYLTFGQNVNQGILIDWGDGSELQGYDGTSTSSGITVDHIYQAPGKYLVRLIPQGETKLYLYGDSYYKSKLWHANIRTENANTHYQENVKRIELGKQIASLGAYSLSNLIHLESITMVSGISDVDSSLFTGNSYLEYLVMPSGWSSIPYGTFKDCAALKGVSVPNNANTVFALAFQNCRTLKNIELSDTITRFYGGVFSSCESLERFYMPDHITKDLVSAFTGCRGLRDLHLSNELEEIGASVMLDAYSMTSIVLPETIKMIGRVTLPKGLLNIYLKALVPPVFESASELSFLIREFKVHVPRGTLEAYQAAPVWSDYADRIIEMEEV